MKNTIQVKHSSASKAVYAQLGRFPLIIIIKQKCQMIKYWKRVIEMRNDYYVKKAYNFTLELHDLGQTNWFTYVKEILDETQFQQAWVKQSMDNRQFAMLKGSLHISYMTECIGNIHDSIAYPKLRTYELFKGEFKFENYLSSTKKSLPYTSFIPF